MPNIKPNRFPRQVVAAAALTIGSLGLGACDQPLRPSLAEDVYQPSPEDQALINQASLSDQLNFYGSQFNAVVDHMIGDIVADPSVSGANYSVVEASWTPDAQQGRLVVDSLAVGQVAFDWRPGYQRLDHQGSTWFGDNHYALTLMQQPNGELAVEMITTQFSGQAPDNPAWTTDIKLTVGPYYDVVQGTYHRYFANSVEDYPVIDLSDADVYQLASVIEAMRQGSHPTQSDLLVLVP